MSAPQGFPGNKKLILPIIYVLYAVLLAITIWNHEMWRDELQSWGIVTHSNTFSDLLEIKKYEGHPILWFAILWTISKITAVPESIQVINYLLSIITAWVILFRSPFSIHEKALIVFGYYFFYEYAAISRNYMLAMMMIVLICALWKSASQHAVWLILLFFLLCFTEAYASILSLSFSGALFLQLFFREKNKEVKRTSILFPLTALAGSSISYFTTVPPEDSEVNHPITLEWDHKHVIRVIGNVWNGIIPFPKFQDHFWSTSLFYETILAALLGTTLLIAILLQSWRYKPLFVFLLFSFFGILLFMYFKYSGYPRHFGHLFIIYFCYEWLKRYETITPADVSFKTKYPVYMFKSVLLFNFLIGIFFAIADWKLPFSAGKQTAAFIQTNFSQKVAIAGYYDCPVTTVANYLGEDIYLLNNLRKSSYIVFRNGRPQPGEDIISANILSLADSLKSLIVVLNYAIDVNGQELIPGKNHEKVVLHHSPHGDQSIRFKNLAYFGNAMVGDENFYVYELERLPE